MAAKYTPQFMTVFDGIRESKRHLNRKGKGDEYVVSDDEIELLAKELLGSEFYCEPWIGGKEPTVLFKSTIADLSSSNPSDRRRAVNQAFKAEHKIISVGVEQFVAWLRAGRPKDEAEAPKISNGASKPQQTPALTDAEKASAKELIELDALPYELKLLLSHTHKPEDVRMGLMAASYWSSGRDLVLRMTESEKRHNQDLVLLQLQARQLLDYIEFHWPAKANKGVELRERIWANMNDPVMLRRLLNVANKLLGKPKKPSTPKPEAEAPRASKRKLSAKEARKASKGKQAA